MRNVGLAVALSVTLAGCAIQRAQVAQDARAQMVGLSKEQVLGCMGPPANKAAEGQTEVWSYASGNGFSSTVATADVSTSGQAARVGNQVWLGQFDGFRHRRIDKTFLYGQRRYDERAGKCC